MAWLARQDLNVYAYTAHWRSPTQETPSDIPPVALQHGAKAARLIDCRDALVRVDRHPVWRVPPRRRGRKYYNTTPLGRAATTTAIVRVMKEDGVDIFSDGSTHKGNDIQRFYRYGALTNPASSTSPADQAFVTASRPDRDERIPGWIKLLIMGVEKAYSTDANCLGATHEAKGNGLPREGIGLWNPIMGVAFGSREVRVEPEEVTVAFEQERGQPERQALRRPRFELFKAATSPGAATASG